MVVGKKTQFNVRWNCTHWCGRIADGFADGLFSDLSATNLNDFNDLIDVFSPFYRLPASERQLDAAVANLGEMMG